MLLALKKYGERMNAAAAQEAREKGDVMAGMTTPYNVRDIVTGADKVENWNRAKKQALGNALGDQTIEHFGEGASY